MERDEELYRDEMLAAADLVTPAPEISQEREYFGDDGLDQLREMETNYSRLMAYFDVFREEKIILQRN